MSLRAALEALTHVLYPPVCVGCQAAVGTQGALCPGCWAGCVFVERPYCEVLGLPFAYDHGVGFVSPPALADPPAFARSRAAVLHRDLGARLVASLKYGDRTDLALPMAAWMRRAGAELLAEADALVPVPLHPRRLFSRRFNQAAELSRHLSRLSGVPHRPLALARVKPTPSQIGLGRAERERNVAGAFRVREGRRPEIEGRRILLIDDVFTTGSTAGSASRALKRGGAREVDVLTFSRVAEDTL